MKARTMRKVKQAVKHPKSDGDGGIKGQEDKETSRRGEINWKAYLYIKICSSLIVCHWYLPVPLCLSHSF